MTSTDSYLAIPGSVAFSRSRGLAIAASLGVKDVRAQFVHYVHLTQPLDERQHAVLEQLLRYGDITEVPPTFTSDDGQFDTFYVYPRTGTISPWSSQATGISHVCGLRQFVKRIERGMMVSCLRNDAEDYKTGYLDVLHDRMTQIISKDEPELSQMFSEHAPQPLKTISLQGGNNSPKEILQEANKELGLALDDSEIDYLAEAYGPNGAIARDPTDVELFMFAQVNSEHCRHKQFNASWVIDGKPMPNSLFAMIRNTHKKNPEYTVSAYSDNAAVLEGSEGAFWAPNTTTGEWSHTKELVHFWPRSRLTTTLLRFLLTLVPPLDLVVRFETRVPSVVALAPRLVWLDTVCPIF